MVWKIVKATDERTLKAGFSSREDAMDWLDARLDIDPDDCEIMEMDEDEEEEFLESQAEVEDDPEAYDYERVRSADFRSSPVDDKVVDGDEADVDMLGDVFEDEDELDSDREDDEEEGDDRDEDEDDL